jgi:hypothetical protein
MIVFLSRCQHRLVNLIPLIRGTGGSMSVIIMIYFLKAIHMRPFMQDSCLVYVVSVCLHVLVSGTYCVVFCFSPSYIPYVASFSSLSIFYYTVGIREVKTR